MYKCICFLLFYIVLLNKAICQDTFIDYINKQDLSIDSLNNAFLIEKDTEKKEVILLEIMKQYMSESKYKEALEIADKGLEIAIVVKDYQKQTAFLYNKSIAYHGIGEIKQSRKCLHSALNINTNHIHNNDLALWYYNTLSITFIDELANDSAIYYINKIKLITSTNPTKYYKNEKTVLINLFNLKVALKMYGEAQTYFFSLIKLCESHKDSVGLMEAWGNNAIFIQMGMKDVAKKNALKSLRLAKKMKNISYINLNLFNLGCLYSEDGEVEKGLSYFKESQQYNFGLGHEKSNALFYNNIGACYIDLGHLDSALYYITKSNIIYNNLKSLDGILLNYSNYSELYYLLNDTLLFRHYLYRIEKISDSMDMPTNKADIYKEMEILAIKKGHYKDAYYFLKSYHSIDSLIIPTKSEFQTKERLFEERLEHENQMRILQRNYSIILISLLMTIVLILIYFLVRGHKLNRQIQSQNIELVKQYEDIESKNIELSKQYNYIENQNQELRHRVGNFVREMEFMLISQLKHSNVKLEAPILKSLLSRWRAKAYVYKTLYSGNENDNNEIYIKNYLNEIVLALQVMYHSDLFPITIHSQIADISLPANLSEAMGVIITECVTNSIKHAFSFSQTQPLIHIIFEKKDKNIWLEIKDNGDILKEDTWDLKETNGFGLKFIKETLRFHRGSFSVDRINGETIFQFTIPSKI